MADRRTCCALGAAIGILLFVEGEARASETTTYTYDALGRLTGASTSGGPNDTLSVATSYDPAGNRCNYAVSTTGGATAGACTGGSGGGGTNQPPVAVNDSGSMTRCVEESFAVLANDSDPDNNTPLALVSVSGGGARGSPSISGTSILFTPSGVTGTATVAYTMRDSLGATASATLTIGIGDGTCGQQQLNAGPEPQAAEAPEAESDEAEPPEGGG